jgi:hypothetical protein
MTVYNPVVKQDIGSCDKCHGKFPYQIIHNGFNDTAYAYCDTCGITTFVGGWDDTDKPTDAPLNIHGPILPATEPWLRPCSCGGRFRHNASPHCPLCNAVLSAEAATSFIERNAEGTRSGWRWQRSWSGIYCLIISDRVTKNNWSQVPDNPSPSLGTSAPPASSDALPLVPTRNPLLFPLVGIAIAAVQAVRDIVLSRNLDLFGIWSIVAAVGLAVLYFGRRPAAGTFMFYSLVPMYPAYFLATIAGWYAEPARPVVYVIVAAVWLLCSYFAWRWKAAYEAFISTHVRTAAPKP